MDGTTAIITDTSKGTIELPTDTAAVTVTMTSESVTLKITNPGALGSYPVLKVDGYEVTAAFTQDTTQMANQLLIYTLNAPTVPVVASGSTDGIAPTFTVTTYPGLWYGVKSGTSVDAMAIDTSAVEQAGAGETSKTFAAPAFSGTVQYYTIAVGVSEAEMTAE